MIQPCSLRCAVAVLTGAVLLPAPAFSQTLGALFPQEERGRQQVLVAQLDVSASRVEKRRTPSDADADPLSLVRSGYYADANGSLRYRSLPSGSFGYGLAASSAVRRYEGDSRIAVLGHSAGGNASWSPSTRTGVSGYGALMYLPSYSLDTLSLGDFTGAIDSVGLLSSNTVDFPLTKQSAFGSNVGVNLSQGLTRRASLSFAYGAARSDFESSEVPTLMSHRISGRFSYSLTRDLSLRLGYGRRVVDYSRPAGVERVALDEIDFGLNYRKALSITESTTFSFNTGTTIEDDEGKRRARVSGFASLNQELGRRADVSIRFNRGAELRGGFGRPVYSDSVSLSGRWQLASRLTASGNAFASFGTSGRGSTSDNDVRSISGTARLTYALWRRASAYVQYLSYYQEIGQEVDFISTIQRDQRNHTVRAGVSFALPLMTARTPRPAPERN
jgi:hypothetical protein